MTTSLIVFTRYPLPGKAKTRLIPDLGAEGAAKLQRRLTEALILRLRGGDPDELSLHIAYSDGSLQEMRNWLGADLDFFPQTGGDLGARMAAAIHHRLECGAGRVILVGSDIPTLSLHHVRQAISAVNDRQVVLGPAADGGYYLVGFAGNQRSPLFELLFTDMPWSTDRLAAETIHRLESAGYKAMLLEQLADIDTPDDLELARACGLL